MGAYITKVNTPLNSCNFSTLTLNSKLEKTVCPKPSYKLYIRDIIPKYV